MDRDGKNRHRNEPGNEPGNEQKNGRKKGRMKELGAALSMELREHRSSFIVYFTLRILVIATLVLQLLNRNYENVFLCALTLLLLVMPSLVQVTFKVSSRLRWRSLSLCLSLRRRY